MAFLSALKVTDVADLRAESSNFRNHAEEVKATTDQMLELVNSTYNVWRGEASTKYSNQFDQLGNDMRIIYDMCMEYSEDLDKIAANYETAEQDNTATASALKGFL